MNEHDQLKSWTAFHVCWTYVCDKIFSKMKKYEKNLIIDQHSKEKIYNQIFNTSSNLVLFMTSFIDYIFSHLNVWSRPK